MHYDEITSAMRQRRKALGLTQEETALLADVGRRTLSEFENASGSRGISLRNLLAIAEVLGLEIEAVPRGGGRR